MAWALYQTVPAGQLTAGWSEETEPYIVFYDIYVRHAFGNYRDVLMEISSNSIMVS